jgi:hypothetical protein
LLIVVGIWGFITDPVLIFPVNLTHNIIHILTGLVFIFAAWKGPAKPINITIGAVYILVTILSFLGLLTFLNVQSGNDPDNYLHLGIAVISIISAFILSGGSANVTVPGQTPQAVKPAPLK